MRSFQGVVCSDLQHLHTHLQLQHDNRLLSPLLLHLFNHRLAPNTVTTDLFSCRFPRLLHRPSLSGDTADTFTFCLLLSFPSTVFCPFLCFWTVFLVFPLGWSLTCHCYLTPLPRGSRASRGKEYRDKSRLWKRRRRASPRLYLCNKPLFYSLLQPSFYPFSHVMPNHPPKNDQLIPPSPPLLSHDDNRLHRWEGEKHPNLCDFLLLTSARWSTPMGRLARLSTGSHIKLRKPVICAAVLCSSRHIDSRFYQLKYSAKTNVSLHQSQPSRA